MPTPTWRTRLTTISRMLSLATLVGLSLLGTQLHADKSSPAAAAATEIKYQLHLVRMYDKSPLPYIFVVGELGFASLASLQQFLASQGGTTLEWAPGCKRLGDEPLSSLADLEAFKRFCAEHKIHFVLVPSG